jgi:AraC-like DNA-binding protein
VDEHVRGRPGDGVPALVAGYSGYRTAGHAPRRHRGLPSPYLTLIFTLDDPLVIAGHPDPRQAPASYDTLAGGLHTAPALIDHDGWQSGVQLAVSPLAARALFGMPAGELASLDVEGSDVLGPLAREIQERLRAAPTWPERFAALDRLLLARIGAGGAGPRPGPRPEVARAWRVLLAAGGQASVPDLAEETGWSERHLRSQFLAEIGLTPKAAARVIRFDRARRRLQAGARGPARLADLAADCGYYDQAHLDREFRALAGCPPTRWLAEEA